MNARQIALRQNIAAELPGADEVAPAPIEEHEYRGLAASLRHFVERHPQTNPVVTQDFQFALQVFEGGKLESPAGQTEVALHHGHP